METEMQHLRRASSGFALADRVVVVTGAASGMGAAAARRFADSGARVALIARRADRLQALEDELGSDRAFAVPADVTDPAALDRAGALVADRLGPADLVIANAGVMLPGHWRSSAPTSGGA